VRGGDGCRPLDFFTGCVWMPKRDVGGDGVAEEKTLLEHQADVSPEIIEVNVPHVGASTSTRPRCGS